VGDQRGESTTSTDSAVLEWLLEEDQPSVRYYALVDLLGRSERDSDVRRARRGIARTGWAADLLRSQKPDGFWEPNAPGSVRAWFRFLQFPQYRTTLLYAQTLADLGLTADDTRIRKAAEQIFKYKLQLSSPLNFFTEEVCAVGNTARTLARFGYLDDRRVQVPWTAGRRSRPWPSSRSRTAPARWRRRSNGGWSSTSAAGFSRKALVTHLGTGCTIPSTTSTTSWSGWTSSPVSALPTTVGSIRPFG
jgi:hypothetical protein